MPEFTVPKFRRFLTADPNRVFGCAAGNCPLAQAFSVDIHADGTWGDEKQLLPRWAVLFVREYDQRLHERYSLRALVKDPGAAQMTVADCLNILNWVDI